MPAQVQLHSVPLSIISVSLDHYQLFFHGIVKLLTGAWEQDFCPSATPTPTPKHHTRNYSNSLNSSGGGGVTERPSFGVTGPGIPVSRSGSTSSASSRLSYGTSVSDFDEVEAYAKPKFVPTTATASAPYRRSHRKHSSVRSIEDDNSNHFTSQLSQEDILGISRAEKIESFKEFINVSVTPVECSVICPTELVEPLFGNALKQAAAAEKAETAPQYSNGNGDGSEGERRSSKTSVLQKDYLAMQIDGDGAESGVQLLDLTSPLNAVGIPIFFVPTYFSDYVLVPWTAKGKVVEVLELSGFVFSTSVNSYITSPAAAGNASNSSKSNDNNFLSREGVQSPGQVRHSHLISVLSDEAVRKFRENKLENPLVDRSTKLLFTGARTRPKQDGSHSSSSSSSGVPSTSFLFFKIIQILVRPPSYFSVSCMGSSEVSLILPLDTLAAEFPDDVHDDDDDDDDDHHGGGEPLLLGASTTDYMVPVASFDLTSMPEDATGIVAGTASQLLARDHTLQMSFLSTARTGIVMVFVDDLESVRDTFACLEL